MTELIRVNFSEFGLDEYQDGWADLHAVRNWGMRGRIHDAAVASHAEHNAVRIAEYVHGWSFERSPKDRGFVDSLDELLLIPLVNRAEAHHERRRRTAEARKSDGGAALSGSRDQDIGPAGAGERQAPGGDDSGGAGPVAADEP